MNSISSQADDFDVTLITHRPRFRASILPLVVLWIATLSLGTFWLIDYSTKPGVVHTSATNWPSQAPIQPSTACPSLLMFIHPRCPCTRASLNELAELMADIDSRIQVTVFVQSPSGWNQTEIRGEFWKLASEIPGVQVLEDPNGREAARFGATTSGHVFLYGPQMKLLYQGGITGARGHAGMNSGRAAIERQIRSAMPVPDEPLTSGTVQCQVFGCPLFGNPSRQ